MEDTNKLQELENKIVALTARVDRRDTNQIQYTLDPISEEVLRLSLSKMRGVFALPSRGAQTFTSSGTFTVPSDVTFVTVEAIGGGAGGWDAWDGSTGEQGSGYGGSYSRKLVDLTGVSSVTVTIGDGGIGGHYNGSGNFANRNNYTDPTAGGDTTFGSYLTAKGGGTSSATVSTSGDFNVYGGERTSSRAGGSMIGRGALRTTTLNSAGNNASEIGGAGSGGYSNGSIYSGGNGYKGWLMVTY